MKERGLTSVAIAGAGVGGLALAALLAQRGVRVVVHDRMARPMPLGSGLIMQPVGLAVLDRMGVGPALRELGAPIERLYGKVLPGDRTVLDVRYRTLGKGAEAGLGVHRGALFACLLDAAVKAGAVIEPDREIVSTDGDGRLVFAGGRTSPRFDLVVDALGVRSPLAGPPPEPLPFGALWASLTWCGEFDQTALEQRYVAARKMVGVLPIGRLPGQTGQMAAFFWSLRRRDADAWRAGALDAWKSEVRMLWPATGPLLDQIHTQEQLVFAHYAHRTGPGPIARGFVHVGDSWHCASPQLGQGANMALLDAMALATALEENANLGEALGEYHRMRVWHIRLYQLASKLFTPAYQSDSGFASWVRDWAMSPLSRIWPAPRLLAALVSGAIGSPLSAMNLTARKPETRLRSSTPSPHGLKPET
jgi:2-polyprenyl-6-methoxyphenol hydroxylase-like FAD-dependent oxidoreductase